jgi:hypothetical protein
MALAAANLLIEGYDQARGDRTGNQPQLSWGTVSLGSATYAIVGSSQGVRIANILINGNSQTNACGINTTHIYQYCEDCTAENCNGTAGVGFNGTGNCVSCYANTCITGFGVSAVSACTAQTCTTGFVAAGSASHCLAISCTTGFSSFNTCLNCTADFPVSAGSLAKGFSSCYVCANCVASNYNGSSNIGFSTGSPSYVDNCAGYNNTLNFSTAAGSNVSGFISLTAQPYTTAGSQYAPNSTTGGGAALRGAGIGVNGQTDDVDVGAVHSAASGGAAGGFILGARFYGQ